jgi:hypothetical protein
MNQETAKDEQLMSEIKRYVNEGKTDEAGQSTRVP